MKVLIVSGNQELLHNAQSFLGETYVVETAGNRLSGKEKVANGQFDLVFYDIDFLITNEKTAEESFLDMKENRPGLRLVVLTRQERIRETMALIKSGAVDYIPYPVDSLEFKTITEKSIYQERRAAELEALRDEFWDSEHIDLIQTNSGKMKLVYEMLKDVSPTNSTVLLNGETGVGKGILARLIHQHSSRKNQQFVHVHCGAIAENLIESELFGHEKGAFTNAIKKKLGKFELANKGTIFLDEVSTLSPAAQVKLLQVMQDSIFQRVGGESDIQVDVRIIAATNDDLKSLIEAKQFRQDLYYRLNVFPIEIPPLRQRLEDMRILVKVFIERLRKKQFKQIKGIQEECLEALKKYDWPGNIRELENLIERAYILEKSSLLTSASFPLDIFKNLDNQVVLPLNLDLSLGEARNRNIENFEKQYLVELLSKTRGRVGQAAEKAGVSVRQLNNLMNKHKVYKEQFKTLTTDLGKEL